MADEIVPRRKRLLESGPKKLPDINSLLKNSSKPEFLQKTDDSIFIEKEKVHATPSVAVPASKASATITKAAEIHKFPEIKDADNSNKKFQNFVDYMQLRDIAGESNDDYTPLRAPTIQTELPPGYSESDATYDSGIPPQNMARGLHKGSKPIRRGDKRGGGKNVIKDKEKARRMKGQSSISTWKPEAFMKNRQEFD